MLRTISEEPTNKETPLAKLNTPITPNALFYIRNHFEVPALQVESWALNITGATQSPLQLTLEQLQSFPHSTHTILLECAGNGRTTLSPPVKGTRWDLGAVSQAKFTGVSLKYLLDQIDHHPDTVEILFIGADQGQVRSGETTAYARSLSLEAAQNPDILLCWAMNDEPLTPDHGYPLRLVVPDWYGMASVKWLSQIELITQPFQGFFQTGEYVYIQDQHEEDGVPVDKMQVRALIHSHQDGVVPAGAHCIEGVAWSGEGEIANVQLSLDEGVTWVDTQLGTMTEKYGWRAWSAEIILDAPGHYTLIARATDTAKNTQPLTPRWNKGGYVNNTVQRLKLSVSNKE